MSLDFPNTPTNGQTFVANGITYKYDSSIGAWLIDSYTSSDYVAPAYEQANTARDHANTAFLSSNSVNTYSDSTYVKLTASSQTITGDIDIVGDLTLSGNTFSIDATRLQVDDPLLYLAANNYSSDIVDIGFIANYVNATGANVHTGLYREHVNKEYYLFQGYDQEPINNHIGALSNNMTLAVLNADIKTSNLVLGGQNTIIWITSAFEAANNAGGSIPIVTDSQSIARYIIFGSSTSGNLTNANVSTTLTFNPGTGRFGIGTDSPSNTLHVIGTANISSTLKSAGLYDSSNRLLLIKNSAGTVVWGN